MTTHDDFEQLAHIELGAVMRQLRSGNLDLARAIRTPSQDRGRDVVPVSFRIATYLDGAIGDLCGKGKKFSNRSEYLRHYAVVGLAIEELLADEDVHDAAIFKAAQQDYADQMASIDETIRSCDEMLEHADGDPQRQVLVGRLMGLREICERNGFIRRLADIDHAINRTR